jgi:signal transduction histidine kinase
VSLDGMIEQAGIRVRVDVPPSGVTAQGDAIKLGQVVTNLLSNALKFSSTGSEVVLRAEQTAEGSILSVADQGIGIAPENHDVIFESFRQVDGSSTRKFGGTGLGLAITRTIVGLHGGRIWVESALGRGSVFKVELPRLS